MALRDVAARDLSAVFSTADFAIEAISDSYGTIVGILDEGDFETETEYGRNMVRSQAVFTTRSAYGIVDGDEIEICNRSYRVQFVVNDGEGLARLYLERQ
jgi:hypothetical protein